MENQELARNWLSVNRKSWDDRVDIHKNLLTNILFRLTIVFKIQYWATMVFIELKAWKIRFR